MGKQGLLWELGPGRFPVARPHKAAPAGEMQWGVWVSGAGSSPGCGRSQHPGPVCHTLTHLLTLTTRH